MSAATRTQHIMWFSKHKHHCLGYWITSAQHHDWWQPTLRGLIKQWIFDLKIFVWYTFTIALLLKIDGIVLILEDIFELINYIWNLSYIFSREDIFLTPFYTIWHGRFFSPVLRCVHWLTDCGDYQKNWRLWAAATPKWAYKALDSLFCWRRE